MKTMNILFAAIFAFALIGCDGFSSESDLDKSNRFSIEMNNRLPELNSMAQIDLSQTNAEERKYMKDFVSDFMGMADFVMEFAQRDGVIPLGMDTVSDNRAVAAKIFENLENY